MRSSAIDILRVDGLRSRLGFRECMDLPFSNLTRDFASFTMDREDAPILRYLYRNFRPRRHLEFGRGEGFGVTLCAKECEAQIWTINLPAGEFKDESGEVAYSRRFAPGERVPEGAQPIDADAEGGVYQTDAGTFIGWLYREAGYAHRVHQIYCDTRQWDARDFEPGFFDSVLIDGGHTPEIVKNDTEKALPLLRSGGICLWHDFCPEPRVLKHLPSSYGVIRAVVDNIEAWCGSLRDLFWIWPTFIPLGVKE